jgi:hypothetical protein
MTTHLVTFCDSLMSRAAELCVDSALRNGVDRNVSTGPSQRPLTFEWLRETAFYRDNRALLDQPRGCGHFAWKPYVILHGMGQCAGGDILIYADAGIEFIAPVQHIIDRMDQDVWLFGNNWEHAHWCKRDVVDEVWPLHGRLSHGPVLIRETYDGPALTWSRFGKQAQASVIFFRVSDYSRAFVAEWLKWCLFEGGRLIDDSPSRLPNHPEFREHRHDQAILTTLAYREGIKLHYWPAVYNRGGSPEFVYEKLPEYAADDYGIMFHHHRRRDHEWPATIT